jgi:hypothetical protein
MLHGVAIECMDLHAIPEQIKDEFLSLVSTECEGK